MVGGLLKEHYLTLTADDFGRPISLSVSTDLLSNESEADSLATEAVEDGQRFAYVYKLIRRYLPEATRDSREAETIYIDAHNYNREEQA